jgi:hypothetical protein
MKRGKSGRWSLKFGEEQRVGKTEATQVDAAVVEVKVRKPG